MTGSNGSRKGRKPGKAPSVSRRRFLAGTASAPAAPHIVPASVLGHGGAVAPVEVGHSGNTISIVSDIATRLRREMTQDWENERFVDDEEGNCMLSRPMRSPWMI